jgi:hypothetical protein
MIPIGAMCGAQGLRELGLRVDTAFCMQLDRCDLPLQGPQWIVLAAHNLASYLNDDGTPAVLTRSDLVPQDAGKRRLAPRYCPG